MALIINAEIPAGPKHPGMPYSVQDCTDFFVKAYHEYLKQKDN